jgi:hypothetical protein
MPEIDPQFVIKRIKDNDSLLDILVQVEDFLDSLDLYAYKHWIDGEIVSGPSITRYWISLILKYPHRRMPDPQGAIRLLGREVRVSYRESSELKPIKVEEPADLRDGERKPKFRHAPVWLVTLEIPRRYIDDISEEWIDQYDDEVEVEDVEDAEDEGLSGEANLKDTAETDETGSGQNAAGAGGGPEGDTTAAAAEDL